MKFSREMLLLYAVTDRKWTGEKTLYRQVEEALKGGATLIQLREKNMPQEDFLKEAREMAALCHRYGTALIINDNVEVALKSGADGVHVGMEDLPVSIGFVVDRNSPVLWRGGMASNALKQLISDAWWGDLDYFLIDMPPGTSDIHLTLVQTLPITGVVVVSTPQEVALADARKGIAMFQSDKVNVPILGLVENMAWFTPAPHPEEKYYIFGNGGATRLAEELGVKLLAQIPLVADICSDADMGAPSSVALADEGKAVSNPEAEAFGALAESIVKACDERNAALPPTQPVAMKS